MPKWDNSTAYWRRLVASITRRVQHACINHRAIAAMSVPRRCMLGVASLSLFFFFLFFLFGRRKPYQSEIRKARTTPGRSSRSKIECSRHRRSWLITVYGIWYLVLGDAICWERSRLCGGWERRVCRGYPATRGLVGFGKKSMWELRDRIFRLGRDFRRCFVDVSSIVEWRAGGEEDCVKFWTTV